MLYNVNIQLMFKSIFKNIISILEFQIFITIWSIIILSIWQIKISYISIITNIIFSPFIIIFLILATIIFFLEIFNIPNILFVYILNYFSILWINIINMIASNDFLIDISYINYYHILLKFILAIISSIVVYKEKNKLISIFYLLIILIFLINSRIIFKNNNIKNGIKILKYNKKYNFLLIKKDKMNYILDINYLGTRDNNIKELIDILKKETIDNIENIISTSISLKSIKSYLNILENINTKMITIIDNQKYYKYSNQLLIEFYKFKDKAQLYNTKINIIDNNIFKNDFIKVKNIKNSIIFKYKDGNNFITIDKILKKYEKKDSINN